MVAYYRSKLSKYKMTDEYVDGFEDERVDWMTEIEQMTTKIENV